MAPEPSLRTNTDQAVAFGLTALAVWRLTHLLAAEDGPADVVARARARLGSGLLGQLADCFGCTSIWVAAPFALVVARRRSEVPVCWLALSGAACLLQRVGGAGDDAAERVVTLVQSEPAEVPGLLDPMGGARTGEDRHGVLR